MRGTSIISILISGLVSGQVPTYTLKKFVAEDDTVEFRRTAHVENGPVKSYILTEPEIWDTDDRSTTHVRGGMRALLVVEGVNKKGKREGVFTWSLIDNADHAKRFRIWEQTYANDQLDGEWRTYNLQGTRVAVRTYEKGREVSYREYGIDGRTPQMERLQLGRSGYELIREFGGPLNQLQTEITLRDSVPNGVANEYHPNGKLLRETNYVNGVLEGPGRAYYENGTLQEEVHFTNGEYDRTKKYYHPNGQLWVEHEYKLGKPWNAIANYDSSGKKRDAGTLRNGNGTLIYYNDDGSVRERIAYVEGVQQK